MRRLERNEKTNKQAVRPRAKRQEKEKRKEKGTQDKASEQTPKEKKK